MLLPLCTYHPLLPQAVLFRDVNDLQDNDDDDGFDSAEELIPVEEKKEEPSSENNPLKQY